MKKILKIAGPVIGLAAFGLVSIAGLHAQQRAGKSSAGPVTTNWVGYLVAGQDLRTGQALVEPMPGAGPRIVPQANPQLEIGLRSDGVVVWRAVANAK